MFYKKLRNGMDMTCSFDTLMTMFASLTLLLLVGVHGLIDRFVGFTANHSELIGAVSSWSKILILFCAFTTASITVYRFIKDNNK